MNSTNCSQYYTSTQCTEFCINDNGNIVQEILDSPMPGIGMYIAAASLICTLAIAVDLAVAVDAFNCFRIKKLWFPCKYFSLNAFSLALLVVAMKLPADLTSPLLTADEKLARVSSLVFMSTAMGNFTTSLGFMENNQILLNLAALGILIITVAGNICIHMGHMIFSNSTVIFVEQIACTIFMLLFLVTLCSSSIMVPTARKYIESVYQKMHTRQVSEKQVEWGNFTIDELTITVRRYWVMAETGSLQFIIARSITSTTSGIMCLLTALILLEAWIRVPEVHVVYKNISQTSSNYKWFIKWILYIQSVGVALGTIAPLFRWAIATKFNSSKTNANSLKDELKVEPYWTQILVEWRESLLPLQIRHRMLRKLLHDAKRLLLNFSIKVQVTIVFTGKLGLLISATCAKVIMCCFHQIRTFEESSATTEQDFSPYVVLLEVEGEMEFPKKALRNICNEVGKVIQSGKNKQPKNLIKLLDKSVSFSGVREFDSKHSHQEPPNCWSLPIVTLTSIAIALPNITANKSHELLRGVSEGLHFVKLIDKVLYKNGKLASIRNAADVVWLRVELYRQWQDTNIQGTSLKIRSYMKVLQEFSGVAEKIMADFILENPLSWPTKVISANSMYRISQTIMEANKDNDDQTEGELFEKLSVMISDILFACLSNLVSVITLKCQKNAIKEREESVRQAAFLLGEGEQILEILRKRELPSLDADKAAYIDEWRWYMKQHSENPVASVPASTTIPNSNGEQVIEIEG